MNIIIIPHARERMLERGATEQEIIQTIEIGEPFPAKFGRTGYRLNIQRNTEWRGHVYGVKQLEAYTVKENDAVVVVTVIVKYF